MDEDIKRRLTDLKLFPTTLWDGTDRNAPRVNDLRD